MSTRYEPRHRAAPTPVVRRVAGTGRSLAATALVTTTMAGSVVAAPAADAAGESRQDRIGDGLDIVRAQKGDAYDYGADGPDRFDCSGLVYYAYQRAGFEHVPRTSSDQARFMNRIEDRNDLRPGDFVFFYDGAATSENVYHVGVFTGWEDGHRMIVHAPGSGDHVRRDQVWTGDWFGGTLRGLG